MAEARSRQLWDHTSEVLAVLINGLMTPRGRVTGKQLHPFARHRPAERLPGETPADGWRALKSAFRGCKRRTVKSSDVRVKRDK